VATSLVACFALVDCREPTQITLEVSSDACDAEIAIYTGGTAALASPSVVSHVCPGTLVLVPSAGKADAVTVTLTQGRGKSAEACARPAKGDRSCVIARRRIGFVPHTSLRLPIALEQDCAGVPCDDTSTCVHGACVSSEVSPSCTDLVTCADAGPPSVADASAPPDAGDVTDGALVDAAAISVDGGVEPIPGVGVSPLQAITVANGRLYFAASSTLGWVAFDGSPGKGATYTGESFNSLAVVGTVLYAASESTGKLGSYDATTLGPVAVGLTAAPHLLATDGTVLWVAAASAKVLRFDPAGGLQTLLPAALPGAIAASPTRGCWLMPTISTVACHYGAQDVTFSASAGLRAIATRGANLFWSDAAGIVVSPAPPLIAVSKRIPGLPAAAMVATDTAVYWMDDTGAIYRYRLALGQAERLATLDQTGNLGLAQSLAVDATYLYAISFAASTVVRLPL
jgi:hypothetical protein